MNLSQIGSSRALLVDISGLSQAVMELPGTIAQLYPSPLNVVALVITLISNSTLNTFIVHYTSLLVSHIAQRCLIRRQIRVCVAL
jgi:hypothetical protein